MSEFKRYGLAASLATLLALGLAGCGGNDSLPPKSGISKVYVMGDSLADVGTFGFKFTVQDPANANNSLIWTQVIANNLGLDGGAQCNFYSITTSVKTNPACSNFAVGGARIQNKPADTAPTIGTQLATRSAVPFLNTDLLLVVGGGNDAADLATAFLTAAAGGAPADFQTFLLQQLSPVELGAAFKADVTGVAAANLYMQNLAKTYYKTIKDSALDKGATRIAVLNVPDVTITPKFQAVLTAQGAKGPTIQGLIRQWTSAFNTQLATSIGADSRVELVDFYTDFADEVAHPANYSLTNATTPVCTVQKSAAAGNFPCYSTELDALPGKPAGWWKSYAFADGFHPTPYAHQLLAASVSRALARAGWL